MKKFLESGKGKMSHKSREKLDWVYHTNKSSGSSRRASSLQVITSGLSA
jgi:hypothetical protein